LGFFQADCEGFLHVFVCLDLELFPRLLDELPEVVDHELGVDLRPVLLLDHDLLEQRGLLVWILLKLFLFLFFLHPKTHLNCFFFDRARVSFNKNFVHRPARWNNTVVVTSAVVAQPDRCLGFT